ncbi:MAG: hypothetical protein J1F31_05095 [Erysipelotrichales bacterium]|nr:hypothetical protein [Erysipelotrichales bacterium]
MEKNEFGSIFICLIMFILMYLASITVVGIIDVETSIPKYAYILICGVISVVLFTIVYELGHIIGAKIGKYKCVFFNLFGLCFYKDNEKWRFKFKGFDGIFSFSETRFIPIETGKKSNPAHFLRGGIVSFFVSVVIGFLIYMIQPIPQVIRSGALIYFAVGLILLLYNVIPMKTDILNDGYRLKLLGSKENAEAYNDFMRIESNNRKDMADEEFKVYEKITPMTVLINRYAYYKRLANNDLTGAEEIVDLILKDSKALDSNTIYRYRIQKLYFVIMTKSKEEASEYYWKEMNSYDRKFLAKDNYIPSKRVYLLVSSIINESFSESKIAIEGMKKRINKIVDKTEKEVESALYTKCLEMAEEALKSNELTKYF